MTLIIQAHLIRLQKQVAIILFVLIMTRIVYRLLFQIVVIITDHFNLPKNLFLQLFQNTLIIKVYRYMDPEKI